jgi:flagellar biosynthesis/type III secretory pathway protein FliH
LYNPLPLGKSGQNGTPRAMPQWQPLKPLIPTELQNAGFVQESYAGSKTNKFALWTVEEQKADHKLAETVLSGEAEVTDVEAKDDTQDGSGHASVSDTPPLSALDAEALEKIKQDAYERGVADGKEMQKTADQEAIAQAEAESLESLAENANQLLSSIDEGVKALQENPAAWNEPLKRLALHLAEQLVLTELSISSTGIQNLIDRCIETLDVQTASSVVVELNPNDLALLQNHKAAPGEPTHTWRMVADTHLLPGSVRVRADDAVVSDLIEHRLETLAHALLEDPKPWQAQTAFHPERLSARRGKAETVEDALPREASPSPLDLSSLDLPDLDLAEDADEGPSHD